MVTIWSWVKKMGRFATELENFRRAHEENGVIMRDLNVSVARAQAGLAGMQSTFGAWRLGCDQNFATLATALEQNVRATIGFQTKNRALEGGVASQIKMRPWRRIMPP